MLIGREKEISASSVDSSAQLGSTDMLESQDERTALLDSLVRIVQPELSGRERDVLVDVLRKKSRYLDLEELRKYIEEEFPESKDSFDEEEKTVFEDMDEESLTELGEEITAEVKEMLSNLGLPSEGLYA